MSKDPTRARGIIVNYCVLLVEICTAITNDNYHFHFSFLPGVSSSSCQSLPCLYFGNGNTLKAIEINSSKVHTVLTSLNSVKAVDVHVKLNLVYWSETRPNAIKRLNVSSGKVEDILTDSNLGEIDGLAVEWESDLIYWTDYTNERIEVAQLDGKNRRTLIAGGMRRPREIAVDPRKGYVLQM